MNTRPLIAIDIDDVLAENARAFIEYSNQVWGTQLTVDDYIEDWAVLWQVDFEVERARADEFISSRTIRDYAHDPVAHEVLLRLKQDYDLIIVTARRHQQKDDTLAWIHERYPGVFTNDDIFFAGIWDKKNKNAAKLTKGQILKALGAHYLIDDQLKHCKGALEHGVRPLLFGQYRWNEADDLPDGITRVGCWQDILEHFDGFAK